MLGQVQTVLLEILVVLVAVVVVLMAVQVGLQVQQQPLKVMLVAQVEHNMQLHLLVVVEELLL